MGSNICVNGSFKSLVCSKETNTRYPLKENLFICDVWKVIKAPKGSEFELLPTGGVSFTGDAGFGDKIILENLGFDKDSNSDDFISASCSIYTEICYADISVTPRANSVNPTVVTEVKFNKGDKCKTVKSTIKNLGCHNVGARVIIDFKEAAPFDITVKSFSEEYGMSAELTSIDSISELIKINNYTQKGRIDQDFKPVFIKNDKACVSYSIPWTIKTDNPKIALDMSEAVFNGIDTDTRELVSMEFPTVNIKSTKNNVVVEFSWDESINFTTISAENISWIASV
jgi:hypothetical protein